MGKRILIATRTPQGLPGGSGFHLRNMIECLEKNGHVLSVIHQHGGAYDGCADPLAFIGVDLYGHDVVIADYSWMCTVFNGMPSDILKICFVHDLRCRIIPCLTAIGYQDAQNWTEEKESKLLQKADVLLVLNDDDASYCRRMAPNAKVIRIGISIEPIIRDSSKEIEGRCIYVGSNNLENAYALNWFIDNVWQKVLAEVPHASLDIVAGHPDDIDRHYEEAQIAVAPHIMKGGLKIKTAESFARGLTVVGNVCAFDGFELPVWATDDPVEMASTIIQFLKDDDYRMNMSETLVMTPNAAYDGLLEVLK